MEWNKEAAAYGTAQETSPWEPPTPERTADAPTRESPVPGTQPGPDAAPAEISGPVPAAISGPVPAEVSDPVPAEVSDPVPAAISGPVPAEIPWNEALKKDCYGRLLPSLENLNRILACDTWLRGIAWNLLACAIDVRQELPWRKLGQRRRYWSEADDAQLQSYLDENYCYFPAKMIETALRKAADDRSFHPIQDYIRRLPEWDGIPRAGRVLIDYLGAEDTAYVAAVTMRTLSAAMARLIEPGTKFDHILVLAGPQGIGKSTLISRLGMEWYSDSLSISDMNDKTAAEKLQGYWIIEIGEMAGMKKADLEKVKAFLSRRDDSYRPSYGRYVSSHPRQCVFFGTTNNTEGYLRDQTGNRRFWTVPVTGKGPKRAWDLDRDTVDQIWAEIFMRFDEEPLTLPPELEEQARDIQREALERDDREGMIRAYLELKLPWNWDSKNLFERRNYLRSALDGDRLDGWIDREQVSCAEIWCECFGREQADLGRRESMEIGAILSRIKGWERAEKPARVPKYGTQRVFRRTQPPPPTWTEDGDPRTDDGE